MQDKHGDMFRAEQVKLLEMSDPMEEGTSQLVSPINFDSHPSSPMDFSSLGFLEGTSPGLIENNNLPITAPPPTTNTPPTSMPHLNKDTLKHLLYVSYLPVNPTEILNERSVVLCGTGQLWLQIDAKIREMGDRANEIFVQLDAESSLVLSDTMTFHEQLQHDAQNYIACICQLPLKLVSGWHQGFPLPCTIACC